LRGNPRVVFMVGAMFHPHPRPITPQPRPAVRRAEQAVSTIEVVGVLCVLAFILRILIPTIMDSIEDARAVATVVGINNLTSATKSYFTTYGKLANTGGTPITNWVNDAYDNWDKNVLLKELLIERPFSTRIATNAYVRLVRVSNTNKTVNILTDIGTVGSISGFNGNNGYYNFTLDYSSSDDPAARVRYFAHNSLPRSDSRPRTRTPVALLSIGGGLNLDGAVLPWSGRGDFPRLPGAGSTAVRRVGQLLRGLAKLAHLAGGATVPTPRVCYPVPPNWPVPDNPGGNFSPPPGSPSHNDPGADSQIVASSTGNYTIVAELVLLGVSVQDAYRLSLAIDGPGQTNWAFFDSLGRVKYDMYNGSGGVTPGIVFIYLGHK
jgi:hypothetical protein